MISFDLFVTETSAFCDIVLPDCGYLQSYNSRPNFPFIFNQPAGLGEWCWPVQQPVVEPAGEQRRFSEILIELAHRAGFGPDLNAVFNAALNLEPEHRLDIQRKYTYVEVCDADLKSNFGNHKGLAWFKENGVLKWPKKPEEVYWRAFTDVRVPIYWEWMEDMGEKIAAIAEPRGLEIPREFYKPLPDFLPCVSHECAKPEFDCYSFYYRDTLHTNSYTMENAWLDEAARLDPFSYNIALNAETGRKKGLETGDRVRVETETGRHVEGRLRLTEAIHPEGVGIAALAGHWATTLPTAKGKGVFYNDLLEIDWAHCSPVNLNLDLCAKVKVTKVE
jgi:molybdopterin-containing oxidoreductase family molybdopterin binding subunit